MQLVYEYSCGKEGTIVFPFPEPPKVYNDMTEKCLDCPYPRHGLVCWNKDSESCLRTDMQAIEARQMLCTQTDNKHQI